MTPFDMNNETFEVPLVLSTENLSYEDIAKLNPFYKEYKAFWNMSPSTSAGSLASNISSRSSSVQSNASDTVTNLSPFLLDLAPPALRIPSRVAIETATELDVTMHNGSQHQPTYHDYPGHGHASHVAVFDCNEQKPIPLVEDPTKLCELDLLELDVIDNSVKRMISTHKRLFGAGGWLGCTADLRDLPVEKPKLKILKDLGKRIKNQVGEMAEEMAKASYPKPFVRETRRIGIISEASIPTSLDARTQAKLYSELEVVICESANGFLIQQYKKGRISDESVKKIFNYWGSKNRPQVVEFRFDQATQRRLICSNIRTLNFQGESASNPVLIHSNLRNWKVLVKEMTVRTFCYPDSAIRKHMHDIHKLLNMLGAPAATFIAFEELQLETLGLMKERLESKRCAKGGQRRF